MSVINRAIDSQFPSSDVTIIAEPGRYYVASAFTLASQVLSIREVRQNGEIDSLMYFINDGMFGSLACKRYHNAEQMFTSSIWGPSMAAEDQVIHIFYIDIKLCIFISFYFFLFVDLRKYIITEIGNRRFYYI